MLSPARGIHAAPLAALLAFACGGGASEAPAKARSARAVAREPVAVALGARRVGDSLRLDIEGVGRGVTRGEPFEDPARWRIRVRSGERDLERLVNGPVKVSRSPVGGVTADRWDTVVRFSVVYAVPAAASSVDVRIEAPDPRSRPLERAVPL